jgi:hypothetical protein
MPGQVIDFTGGNLTPTDLSLIRLSLPFGMSLMLWAGDCVNNGIPDVTRLENYQVFLCRGFPDGLNANILALRADQFICILNVNDEEQMSAFRYVFRERFSYINSDYRGNTPSLPLRDYIDLLELDGTARHVFGINHMVLPYEDYYRVLEIFAPILSSEWKDRRRWSREVLDLAKRDSITPSMVWTDEVLKCHPFYEYVIEAQNKFEKGRKEHNPRWPDAWLNLEGHWDSLPLTTLFMPSFLHAPTGPELMLAIEVYLPTFSAYLSRRIQRLPRFDMLNLESLEHKCAPLTPLEAICEKLRIIRILSTPIPPGLFGQIGYFMDDRKDERLFDLTLRKVELAS